MNSKLLGTAFSLAVAIPTLCAVPVKALTIFSTGTPVPLDTLGGIPIFGRQASQSIFGLDWGLGVAVPFTCGSCNVEYISFTAAGPSALGMAGPPQTVRTILTNDEGTGVPGSTILGSFAVSGIDTEQTYTTQLINQALGPGTYWVGVLPATDAVDDETMVALNRTLTTGPAAGTLDSGISWIVKPPTEQPGIKITGECVPGPLPLLGVGAAFGYSRKLRKRIKTSKTPEVLSVIG
jgi:hypothetical protein